MDERLKFGADALLLSYARIFFSESRLLGAFVLASTLVVPVQALLGLIGCACTCLCAYFIGMDRESVGKGVYGFNGILTGLALGFFFAPNLQLMFVLLAAAVILTLITVFLNTILYQYCGLPAMSMPLNLAAWLILAASSGIGHLHPHNDSIQAAVLPAGLLPELFDGLLSSLGSVLFQANPLTGIVLAAGLLIWSRIGLVLMVLGFSTAARLQVFLGIDPGSAGGCALSFNHMFAALAVGGIFTVPGPGSLLLSFVAAGVSLIILTGAEFLFPHTLSPLALPFNLAVMLALYTLRLRLHPSLGVRLAPVPPGSPEENLSRHRENLRAWKRWGVAIALPFEGTWAVSQGVDGGITHQGDWRFAYDFEVRGHDGTGFRHQGTSPEDYYAFGLPILAPAAGTVYSIRGNVADNEIRGINTVDNWGNYIVIEHARDYYSCLAHLKQSSIRVKPGDQVAKGEPIALCGNSGRSLVPHLHFQMQMSPLIGAPSLSFEFQNIMVARRGRERFAATAMLEQGDAVSNVVPCAEYGRYFPYAVGSGWPFRFRYRENEKAEMWEMGVDFYGNVFLASYPSVTKLYFLLADGLLTVKKIEGNRNTGLFFFGCLIADLPLIEIDGGVAWTSVEPADYALWPVIGKLFDVFSLFGFALRQKIDTRSIKTPDGLIVATRSKIMLQTPVGLIPLRRQAEGELVFRKDQGLVSARAGRRELQLTQRTICARTSTAICSSGAS